MIEIEFSGSEIQKQAFSKLKLGETFCHSLPACLVFMKKPHTYNGKEFDGINLQTGQSVCTDLSAKCIPITLKAVVEI